jgi:hypothetical protein
LRHVDILPEPSDKYAALRLQVGDVVYEVSMALYKGIEVYWSCNKALPQLRVEETFQVVDFAIPEDKCTSDEG